MLSLCCSLASRWPLLQNCLSGLDLPRHNSVHRRILDVCMHSGLHQDHARDLAVYGTSFREMIHVTPPNPIESSSYALGSTP